MIGLLVTPAGGFLIRRIGLRAGIAVAISACLAGALVTLSHSLWIVIIVGLGLVCTGVFLAQATANSFLRVAAPEGGRASAAGLYICCYYIGGTIGGRASGLCLVAGKMARVCRVDRLRAGHHTGRRAGWLARRKA